MKRENQYLVFNLEEWRIALHLSAVDRVVWAVGLTPLPEGPDSVRGLVNVQGCIMPVVDIRGRFGLAGGELDPADRFVIVRTSRRIVALWVDGVDGVIAPAAEEVVDAGEIVPGMKYIDGVVRLPDGVILIHNLDRFLSIEEERALEKAIEEDEG